MSAYLQGPVPVLAQTGRGFWFGT